MPHSQKRPGKTEKARELLNKLIKKYQENLKYYSTLDSNEQVDLYVEIITDNERNRDLLLVMKERGDNEFYNSNKATFNTYNKMFSRFKRDNE